MTMSERFNGRLPRLSCEYFQDIPGGPGAELETRIKSSAGRKLVPRWVF